MSATMSRRRRFAKWRIDLMIHEAVEVARTRAFEPSFQELLAAVLSRTDLLRAGPIGGYPGWRNARTYLRGLLALCAHRRGWRRDLVDWSPEPSSCARQFAALCNRLMCEHALPHFLTRVWLETPSAAATRHQKLFKHLALGGSVRGAETPIRLTKKMARFFLQAPDHLSVEQAFRWSQIRGLGGDAPIADAVLASPIGDRFEHELFWSRVLEFIVAEPRLEITEVRTYIEFLQANIDVFSQRGTMKQHQLRALLSEAKAWAKRRGPWRRTLLRWRPLPIGGLWHFEKKTRDWSLRYCRSYRRVDLDRG